MKVRGGGELDNYEGICIQHEQSPSHVHNLQGNPRCPPEEDAVLRGLISQLRNTPNPHDYMQPFNSREVSSREQYLKVERLPEGRRIPHAASILAFTRFPFFSKGQREPSTTIPGPMSGVPSLC